MPVLCRPPLLAGDGVIDRLTRGGPRHSKQEPRGVPQPSQPPAREQPCMMPQILVIVLAFLNQECMTKLNLRLERNLYGFINWADMDAPTGHDDIETAMRTLCSPPLLSGL